MLIALTGGIGSGKSLAAKFFVELGVRVLYADNIAKEIMNTHPQIQNKLQKYFGSRVIDDTNKINKFFLRQEIFNSDTKRLWLNDLIHPLVWKTIEQRARDSQDYVIAEIPLILESNNQDKVQKIIVIDCSVELQIQRASLRDGISNTEILKVISSQMPRKEKLLKADYVFNNDTDFENLKRQVYEFHHLMSS
ncbi:MAG: dephospho-CoA kinase [Francisellaceae bacterium]|jgi:dephospho-CoA kinase|nr:dephospho-CoA kinase [Francisellaceae bacterium]MBT6207345.1 dephospho-CoA kinase [Francisellaceae bacterium]MBT6537882.1 dephospho-CoA kinase [Francisellaceae bacterium]